MGKRRCGDRQVETSTVSSSLVSVLNDAREEGKKEQWAGPGMDDVQMARRKRRGEREDEASVWHQL